MFGFYWLAGFRKGNIILELDDFYIDRKNHIAAVERELKRQGKNVCYKGEGEFIIDGKFYYLQAANDPRGVQRSVLKLMKE